MVGQADQYDIDRASAPLDPRRGLDPAAEREERAVLAGWERFARRHGLAFRAEPDRDPEAAAVLGELGLLGVPVARVRGWTRGPWRGRETFGFCTFDATAVGSIYRLRCHAVRLRRDCPDVVQHRLLDGDRSMGRRWHPRGDRYAKVTPPAPPSARPRPRGRFARFTADAVDRYFRPAPRQLHTDDPVFATAVAALAARDGLDLFQWSWAAKDGWLVAWKSDAAGGEGGQQRARFMDFLPALAGRLEQAPMTTAPRC